MSDRSPSAEADESHKRQSQPCVSTYKYDDLQSGQIRILVLDPGSEDDELSGQLAAVNLQDCPLYKAISYTWGAPTFSETLHLSGGTVKITQSLASALRRFRDPEKPLYLWADAVCINQNPATEDGFAEKNQQVSMMGDIYSNAEEVLIWLGQADDRDTMFFGIMSTLLDLVHPDSRRTGVIGVNTASKSVESLPKLEPNALIGCRCCHHLVPLHANSWPEALEAAVDFWDKPWFRRVWVLQEAQLAKTARFFCGMHQLPFADVHLAHEFLQWYLIEEGRTRPSQMLLQDRLESSEIFGKDGFRHYIGNDIDYVVALLWKTSEFIASVPHDHLFALRGLNSAIEALLPSVDYTVPHDTLYKNFSASLLTSPKSWCRNVRIRREVSNALARACALRAANDDLLPSWSLIYPSTTLMLTKPQSVRTSRPFDNDDFNFAAGGTMRNASMPGRIGQNDLRFKGYKLGVLESILADSSMPAVFNSSGDYLDSALSPWIKRCGEFLKACSTRVAGLDIFTMMDILLPCSISLEGEQHFREYINSISGIFSVDEAAPVDCSDPLSEKSMQSHQAFDISRVSFDGEWATTLHDEYYHIGEWFHQRKHDLAKSSDNRFCWVPPNSAIGDCVCLLSGVTVPFLLRPQEKGRFRLIGDAYVHGAMYGEAWPEPVQEEDEEDSWETRSSVSFTGSDIDDGEDFYDPREDDGDRQREGSSGLLEDFIVI